MVFCFYFLQLLSSFFYWQVFINLQPEKYDINQYKGFFMEKMAQIRQISKSNNNNKFQ
jgi:hypothetical protein